MSDLYAVVGYLCTSEILAERIWLAQAAGGLGCFAAGALAAWAWHRRRCRRVW